MSERMSIPIHRDYNKIWKDFQIEKIKSISKDNLIVELQNSESWIYELMKDEAISLFLNTSKYTNGTFSTDDLYTLGVNITAKQISKRCFFSEIEDYDLILKKTKSRVVNNIRNYFSPFRKVNYKNMNQYLFFIDEHSEPFEEILDELDLQKIDKETIKIALAKVWQDALTDTTFDIIDFEELCRRFQFESNEVLSYNPYDIPLMAKENCNNGNYQLVLIFEFEEII
ncbi:hypothetical protein L5F43_07315 [Aliarcobacter butzleri]|uniref:hypothetical protein n=1 Tax=Aliarcobacter butzleri TaxID=28197 RepID=UPI001EDC0156|nr:hypothetical protein [Aliarcobacter butzleri]MCG3706299.1 hypothetical protein [Aliarcobacter butzleri]